MKPQRSRLILALPVVGVALLGLWLSGRGAVQTPRTASAEANPLPSVTEASRPETAGQTRAAVAAPEDLGVVTGRLLWDSGAPIAGVPYLLRPSDARAPRELVRALGEEGLRRTSATGAWSARPADAVRSRIWFALGVGLFVSFEVPGESARAVDLRVEDCRLRVDMSGLAGEECSLATMVRVRDPATGEWSLEDFRFVEAEPPAATAALYLVTQFLGGRRGDGPLSIPAVRGLDYAVYCQGRNRKVVTPEVHVVAPASCGFVFERRERQLVVEVVDAAGRRLEHVEGHRGFFEPGGRADLFRPFRGGWFRAAPESVLHDSVVPELGVVVVLSDGEMFSRRVPEQDRARGTFRLVKGSGVAAEVFSIPAAPPSEGLARINRSAWALVAGAVHRGASVELSARPPDATGFFYQGKDDALLVTGLAASWTTLWFRTAAGHLATATRGDRALRWAPTRKIEGIDWQDAQRYRGGRVFCARVEQKFTSDSAWETTQMWDLAETPSPPVWVIAGLLFRVVLVHGDGTRKEVLR